MDAVMPTAPDAVSGHDILMSKTCSNCHAIRGTIAHGEVGPDLTHIASRAEIAGGVLTSDSTDMTKWLQSPQTIKPGCNMPDLDLTPKEVHDLVAYLETLK